MKVLSRQELKKAEEKLRNYFPWSREVYGYVCIINRVEDEPTDVLVDKWPDFSVVLVKPRQQQTKSDLSKDLCVFTKDNSCLRNILIREDVCDWKQYISLSVDQQHEKMLQAVAEIKGVPLTKVCNCYIMSLPDESKLVSDRLSNQVSSVQESHIALINSTWKFGMGEITEPILRSMIRNFPSCCVLDSQGQPVSWILTYASCAMGVLYTLPEHRGKGYAKALVSILAKKLHSQGYPVYCFIEEENQVSYKLFTSLGFTAAPSYRAAWFSFNETKLH